MTTSFEDLGVTQPLVETLNTQGIETAFPIQQITIPDALAGKDICGKAKTGSGKTLAFAIPCVQLVDGLKGGHGDSDVVHAVVLVPTRELATQVLSETEPLAEAMSLTSTAVYGGANLEAQVKKLAKPPSILVATPGRLIDLIERQEISLSSVGLVILDEADRMADMGFLPQVEWILRQIDTDHQTLLFSATLDGAVDTLVSRYQTDPVYHSVESKEVTVEQMEHRFLTVHHMDKAKVTAAIINAVGRVIIFCNTKRGCDRLADDLETIGTNVQVIHGDLRQRNRERALDDFATGGTKALIATDVAARGIHVDDVDVVVHYDPPEDHKTYLHRSGRTARAGSKGMVVTLVEWDQELIVRRLQKRMGLELPLVKVFSSDERLGNLSDDSLSQG